MSDYPFPESQLLEFVMDMPCGVAIYLKTGEVCFCNSTAQRILGIVSGQGQGLSLANRHHQVIDIFGSVIALTQDPLTLAVTTAAPVAGQLLGVRDPTGEVSWISLYATPHLDAEGAVSAVSATFVEILLPQLDELKASVSSQKDRPLHDEAKVGLWTWNFRTGEFNHDRNFSVVTGTGRVRSVEGWSYSVVEEDRLKFLLQFNLLEAGIPKVEFAYKSQRGNGSQQLFFVRAAATNFSLERETTIEGSVIEITALLPGTLEVGELVDSMTDGYIAIDRNWCISFANKQAERLLNLSHIDIVGVGLWDQFPTAFETEIARQLELAMSGKHVSFDFVARESRACFEIRAHPLPNGVAVYFRDITEQHNFTEERERLLSASEETKERLSYAASHDALTNLPNRTALLSWIDDSLRDLPRYQKLALLFIDLDRFKRVNDTHGHAEGDRVLIQISHKLRSIVDHPATVARLGGDEFVVALRIRTVADAQQIANDILSELAKPINVRERPLVVTASIGISISNEFSSSETLLRDADVALYEAKEQGRNRIRMFDSAIRQKVVTRLDTEADLRDALKLDQISVHFQPIFQVANRELAGFETLTRWFHQDKGSIPPEIFISVAEESGLILPLGEYLIDSSVDLLPELSIHAGKAANFTIWINVSSRQLEDYSFVNHLITSYQENFLPGQLGIELTESVLGRDSTELYSILHALASRGVKIAIDDFGRGYSSLSHLVDYPIDLIILGHSMIDEIATTPGSALVPAIINLAHAINAKVCASGIETELQLRHLIDLGVDLISGYYLGYPQPIDQLSQSIHQGRRGLAHLDSSTRSTSQTEDTPI